MSSQGGYRQSSMSSAYYPSHPSSSLAGRDNGTNTFPAMLSDFSAPPPMDTDFSSNHLSISSSFSGVPTSVPVGWDTPISTDYPLDLQFGEQRPNKIPRGSARAAQSSQQDPLVQWYADNDGPWVGIKPIVEERAALPPLNKRIHFDERRQDPSIHAIGTGLRYPITPSDSGYGTRQSVGNTSVVSGDIHDRDLDSQSIIGPTHEFPYQGNGDQLNPITLDGMDHEAWSAPSVDSSARNSSLVCPECNKPVKTRSELKKHDLRHKKPFLCVVPGCDKKGGFSTPNDLDRHVKSKHRSAVAIVGVRSTKRWRCLVPKCKSKDKSWPRCDNFRSHLRRVHGSTFRNDEEFDNMVLRGECEDAGETVSEESNSNTSIRLEACDDLGSASILNTNDLEVLQAKQLSSRMPTFNTSLEVRTANSMVDQRLYMSPSYPSRVPTIEPLERYSSQPASNTSKSVSTVLDPQAETPIDPALLRSDIEAQASKIRQTKNDTNMSGPVDTTILEAVKTALVAIRRDGLPLQLERHEPGAALMRASSDAVASSKTRKMPTRREIEMPISNSSARMSRTASPETNQDTLALEVLKIIHNLGFTVHKTMEPSSQQTESQQPVVPLKAEKKVSCHVCKNFDGRPCELRKHMRRHSRPYGCTFENCGKTFGSKNDWKRHESTQHFHQETYRCMAKLANNKPCGSVHYRRQTFKDHLKTVHQIKDDSIMKEQVESCRTGKNCQSEFWCGFCVKLVELEKTGPSAWDERFDHIDDHFMGRGEAVKSITDWQPLNEDVGELEASNGFNMDKGLSPRGMNSLLNDTVEPVQRAYLARKNGKDAQSTKRKRYMLEEEQHGLQSRKKGALVRTCCQCDSSSDLKLSDRCDTCPDLHRFCKECKVERPPPIGDDY